MSCSPSIEQFAIRQNATPFTTSSAFWAFSLREAFRFEMGSWQQPERTTGDVGGRDGVGKQAIDLAEGALQPGAPIRSPKLLLHRRASLRASGRGRTPARPRATTSHMRME